MHSIIEKMTEVTHHSNELQQLINSLPSEERFFYLNHDFINLRKNISNQAYFSDAVAVVRINSL